MKMKNKFLFRLISFTLFILFSQKISAQADISAEEIIAKNMEKMGGELHLAALSTAIFEQTVTMNNQDFPQTLTVINNKALKMETVVPGNKIVVSLKDTSGWQINPYGTNKVTPLSKAEIRLYKYQADLLGALYKYKEKNITATLEGKDKVSGKEVYKINLLYSNGYKTNVYVSAKDFLVLKIDDAFREIYFSAYKKAQGYYFPYTTEIKTKAGSTTVNVLKITVNSIIDEKIFDPPAQ